MQNGQIGIISDMTGFDRYLEKARMLIDQEITGLLPELTDLGLCERIVYVLQTRGKRLRPILVMLSAQSVGGDTEIVKKLAMSIELLHAATLIHDDILDHDAFRRNALTVNTKWSIRDAVLVGDALASLSLNLAADCGKDVIKILSRTCLLLSDGEFMDVENAHERLRESDYVETIKRKSASLFKAATQCGAIAAHASRDEIDGLAEFGENFGLAYQIKDDISDVTGLRNTIPQDINEFRATLPIIHFCQSVKQNIRDEFFEAIVAVKSQDSMEKVALLGKLHRSLERAGSLHYCAEKINQYVENAIDNLGSVRDSLYKAYLVQIANSLRFEPPK